MNESILHGSKQFCSKINLAFNFKKPLSNYYEIHFVSEHIYTIMMLFQENI